MKIAGLIITYLTGLVFVVFGFNHFLNFIPMPEMPAGDMTTWASIMHSSGYMTVVKVLEILIGLMLLVNFKRPLAWLLILPINVNIVIFEVLLAHAPGLGILLLLLNFFMIYANREQYKGLVA